jgi:threonylcarbamoyladenosine tRNA methylthiotransferase MtaB
LKEGPKTTVIHFGCRLNQFESDGIKANLADNAHTLTQNLREADFVVINTCTVTNKADYKNRAAIRRAHRLNPQAKIVVTGCYATTDAEELRSLPGVYRVVSNDEKHRIAEVLQGGEVTAPASNRFFFSANHDLKSRATLKIQDGCNKSCSYCKIPQARGRGVSRSFGETLDAARKLIDAGFGELVLTGVNIGWYEDQGKSFHTLVESLLDLPGDFHLRISSIEPGDVNERFAAFYQHPKMARFLHIPLQSGSKRVLKIMRRGYTPENFMRRIEHVRKVCPEVHIGTDVIVGFPAEGDAEFKETLDFCRAAEFANIHIFPFSKRRNTPIVDWLVKRAARRSAQLSNEAEKHQYKEVNGAIIRERSAALAALKKEMADAYIRRMEGQNLFAVAERIEDGNIYFLTENYLRGVLPAADYPGLRRGKRFALRWSSSLIAGSPSRRTAVTPS